MERIRCIACDDEMSSPNKTLTDRFCVDCANSFGIETEQDAEELMAMFDGSVANWMALRELAGLEEPMKPEKEPAKPKVDPAAVAAGIRTQVDYRVVPISGYRKPITYICAKNGLFEARDSDLATIITKPKEVLGLVEELKEGITLKLPKVPFLFLQQIVTFFRGVETRMKGSSEALVQIWWDRTESRHILHVPEQQVSGGSVRHQSTFDQDVTGRYLHMMDIHSHGSNMSAFWSGVDDADERRVTTERMFGVIGKISQPVPMWKWRMRTRDGFIDLNVTDVFAMPTERVSFTVSSEDLFRNMSNEATFKDGRVSLWCPVDPFSAVEIPAEWYEQVKSYSHGNVRQYGSFHPNHGGFLGGGPAIRGLIYIDGQEHEVDGDKVKPTGHTLLRKVEQNNGSQR